MAGTSNFQQWNPNQTNQETDSQFTSDSLRVSGIPEDAIFPSNTANKLFYQITTMTAAFNAALAQKGYSPSDANLAQLQAVYANILTDADVLPNLISIGYAPTLTFDGSAANGWEVVMYGNVTSLTFANIKPGQEYKVIFVQDSVGSRTVTWPAAVTSAISSPGQPDVTPYSVNIYTFTARTDGSLHPSAAQVVS